MLVIERNQKMKQMRDWSGSKVVVIGAARQGIALVRYLLNEGANVVLNDRQPSEKLDAAREALANVQVDWVLGGHPLSLLDDADLVCISGGVPFDLPIVEQARKRGIEISNDSQIFLEICPCRVIGITGSAGKTTTTTLVGLIAQAAVEELTAGQSEPNTWASDRIYAEQRLTPGSKVWVGGNIGTPLLSMIDQIGEDDLAVMELSSFQLEVMKSSPEIAAILNITPNHLDRHKTMRAYSAAKARILAGQSEDDIAILNSDDPITWMLQNQVRGRLVAFSGRRLPSGQEGAYLSSDHEWIVLRTTSQDSKEERFVINREQVPLRGEHNLQNVLGACAIAYAAGISATAMEAGINNFEGIPHRMEFVRTWGGADWYNDSIATAPERAVAAVNSFSESMILLAGGRDKDLPWDNFADAVLQRVKYLILFGEAAGKIFQVMKKNSKLEFTTIIICSSLNEAVDQAAKRVSLGDVVLLSPGGTSFDEFQDFEARGEAFKKWVLELP
jgi:UDP-N-acetylmuramoylalanine--D-glutamate ligase